MRQTAFAARYVDVSYLGLHLFLISEFLTSKKNFITGVDEGYVPGANIELSLLDFVSECRSSSLPDFEDAPIDAGHLRDTSIVITSEQLYERFEAARKAWFKEQAKKKLTEKPSEADTSAAKVSTSKKSKGKEAKTGKKRKLNR